MKKKIIFLFCVLILALALGGFFYWQQHREIKGSPNDYVIKQTPEGTFVENKKAGLVVKVPEEWKAEKINEGEGSVILYSPEIGKNLIEKKIDSPLKNGCIIETSIMYRKMDFSDLKLEAKYNLSFLQPNSVEFKEIKINNYKALKTIADTQKIGPGIGIDIPYKKKVHSFLLLYSYQKKEDCLEKFNNFLGQISIK